MAKIAIYKRISSAKQVGKDGDSLGVQQEKCENYLKSQGYSYDDFIYFEDEGISGTTVEGRDDLKRLIKRINSQKIGDEDYIEGICCMDLSRISRSMKHTIDIFKLLKNLKLKLYTVDGAFIGDLDSRNSKIMMSIFSMLNEIFIDQLSEKVTYGMKNSSNSGHYQGGNPPLGYHYTNIKNSKGKFKKKLEVDEKEKHIIKLIFQWFLDEKMSISGVSKRLNENGYLTKTGKLFRATSVLKILENPIYFGKIFWGKRRTISKDEDTGAKEVESITIHDVVFEDLPDANHEPIIDVEIFKKTLLRLNDRKQHRETRPVADLRSNTRLNDYFYYNKKMFSNILRCPNCNGKMTSYNQKGKKRKDGTIGASKIYYKCIAYSSGQTSCEGYYSVQENRVFNFIKKDFFSKLQEGFDLIKQYNIYLNEKNNGENKLLINKEIQTEMDELSTIKKNKKSIEMKLERIIDDQISVADKTSRKYAILQKKVDSFENQLDDIAKTINEHEKKINYAIERKEQLLTNFRKNEGFESIELYFESLPLPKKREALEQVYDVIVIDTISNAKNGPKKLEVKKIVENQLYKPISICKILGIEDFEDFNNFLTEKGKPLLLFDKHFPRTESYFDAIINKDNEKLENYFDELGNIVDIKNYTQIINQEKKSTKHESWHSIKNSNELDFITKLFEIPEDKAIDQSIKDENDD